MNISHYQNKILCVPKVVHLGVIIDVIKQKTKKYKTKKHVYHLFSELNEKLNFYRDALED